MIVEQRVEPIVADIVDDDDDNEGVMPYKAVFSISHKDRKQRKSRERNSVDDVAAR